MITSIAIASLVLSANLDARVDTLRKHLEQLKAVPVSIALEPQKSEKLQPFPERLNGITDPAQIDAVYKDMDAVRSWLLANATEQPQLAPGECTETETAWKLQNPELTLVLDKATLTMTVDTRGGKKWTFKESDDSDVRGAKAKLAFAKAKEKTMKPLHTGYSIGMTVTLKGFDEAPEQEWALGFHLEGNEVRFLIAAPKDNMELEEVRWPKKVITGASRDDMAVIPRMQGMLLPGDWDQKITAHELVNSRTLYMPWFGQIQEEFGIMTILETSDDAGVQYRHTKEDGTDIQPVWYSSMRHLRYLRVARYAFDDHATYVTMAKRYRRYVKETGRFVTLEEKRARNHELDKVIGHPVVHTAALYHNVPESHYFNKETVEANHSLQTFDEIGKQLTNLHGQGVDAYVHCDGWGYYGYDNGHPDIVPVGYEQGGADGLRALADLCRSWGWVFALHDQYRDFYYNAKSMDSQLVLMRPDGTWHDEATWCGGRQSLLSPLWAPGYVRRNHDWLAEHNIKVGGAYLDVFAIVPLEESYQPFAPVTRTDCFEYRKNCLDLLRARGYVMSSEEPVDRFVPVLDLVHHGPYFVFNDEKHSGIPVPLFNLVYHDSILLPWSMSESGGWGIPEGDAGYLHEFLNAGLPYVEPNLPYGKDATADKVLARAKEAAALAQRCAFAEMENHEFLDGNWRKQRSTFSDGTRVSVDFAAKTYEIEAPASR